MWIIYKPIIFLLYILIIIPIGLILQKFNIDLLKLKKKQEKTYWEYETENKINLPG